MHKLDDIMSIIAKMLVYTQAKDINLTLPSHLTKLH